MSAQDYAQKPAIKEQSIHSKRSFIELISRSLAFEHSFKAYNHINLTSSGF